MFELANELETVKTTKRKLEEELSRLKTYLTDNCEPHIKKLIEENQNLKIDLSYTKHEIKQLQNSDSQHENCYNQIESLQKENEKYKQELKELKDINTITIKQNTRLQVYEKLIERMKLFEVNKKLYQTINLIGKGGFSEVFSCYVVDDPNNAIGVKNVAVKKVNLKELDEENRKVVMKEIELLKQLNTTDKVAKLYDL
jgi:hypothetical protein